MRTALARHRDLLLATALALFGVASLAAGGTYEREPNWPGPWWLALLAILLMSAPLAVRRTRPLASSVVVLGAIAGYALLAGGGEATLGFLATTVTVFSGAAYARRPWIVAALALVALVVHNLRDVAVRSPADWFWSAGFIVVALLLGLAVRNRQIRIVSLEHEAERASREQAALVAAATAAERAAIARELHDIVAHAVSVVVVQAQAGSRALADDPTTTGRSLEVIEDTGRAALADLRRLLRVLGPEGGEDASAVDPSPGLAHLGDLVDRFRDAGLAVSLQESVPTPTLSGAADLAAYRLVQEALTNTVRHAPGATARVRVDADGSRVRVAVEDRGGRGGDVLTPGTGRGLIGMRERVGLAGGRLRECGPTGDGFRVVAELPHG